MVKNRLSELDCLRGIACLAVLIFHYTNYCYIHFNYLLNFRFGITGVDLFFMISGFVIYMTLNKVNSINDFIRSRFIRLYPTFWFALILTSVVVLSASLKKIGLLQFLANFTMVPGWFGIDLIDNAYWTLLVEIIFYIIIAALFFLNKKKSVISKGLLILIGCILINAISLYYDTGKGIVNKFPIIIFWNLFFSGILFYKMKTESVKMYYHIIIVINIFFTFFTHDQGGTAFFCTNAYEHTAMVIIYHLIFYLFVYDRLNFIVNNMLVFLGMISYALYLIHGEIGFIMLDKFHEAGINTSISILLTCILVLLVATGITFYIERPAQKILKNLFTKKISPEQ